MAPAHWCAFRVHRTDPRTSSDEELVENGWEADGALTRHAYDLHEDDDDFGQPGTLVREVFSNAQRDDFITTVAGELDGVKSTVPVECIPVLEERRRDHWSADRGRGEGQRVGAAAPGMGNDADENSKGRIS